MTRPSHPDDTSRPDRMTVPSTRRPRRYGRLLVAFFALALAGSVLVAAAVATDALGAGQRWESVLARVDRFIAGPVAIIPTAWGLFS